MLSLSLSFSLWVLFVVVAPEDYISDSGLLMFSAGDVEKCHTVQIVNDSICEDEQESFTSDLVLESGTPLITVDPNSARVVIEDCSKCLSTSLISVII